MTPAVDVSDEEIVHGNEVRRALLGACRLCGEIPSSGDERYFTWWCTRCYKQCCRGCLTDIAIANFSLQCTECLEAT